MTEPSCAEHQRRVTVRGSVHNPGPPPDELDIFQGRLIYRLGPWRNSEHVQFETLDWVDWFNNRRLLEPIGHIPPAEHEASYHECQKASAMVAGLNYRRLRKTRGGSNMNFANSWGKVWSRVPLPAARTIAFMDEPFQPQDAPDSSPGSYRIAFSRRSREFAHSSDRRVPLTDSWKGGKALPPNPRKANSCRWKVRWTHLSRQFLEIFKLHPGV